MTRIFLSLPMSGRTDEEIREEISKMKSLFLLKNPFEDGVRIEFVDNSKCDVPYPELQMHKTPNLCYLSEAIYKMGMCDAVLFAEGYQFARGCKVEFDVANYYDIPIYNIFTIDDEITIRKLDKCEITKDSIWGFYIEADIAKEKRLFEKLKNQEKEKKK